MSRQAMPEPAFPVPEDIHAGLQFYNQGHYPAAVRCYQLALRREPESALGHYLLGLTLMATGEFVNAQAEWEAASRSPDDGPQTEWARRCAQILLGQLPSDEPAPVAEMAWAFP